MTRQTSNRRRAWWHVSAHEARVHATLAAILLWSVAAIIAFAGPGYRSIFGPLKAADFIHLYTLGHIDERTAPTTLYNIEELHRLQVRLVPESAPEVYPTVYPPHTVILFRPFAGMSYGIAALVWAAILAAGYALCLWLAWRPFRDLLSDRRLLIAASAAFPPFWYLVLHGQTSLVLLLGFTLGWLALEHRRPFWAGMAFGLLLIKPQFALVLAPLVLLCGEWSMLAGAVASIALQATAVVIVLGRSVLWDYAALVARFPQLREVIQSRPDQMHSIATITNSLLGDWGMAAWAMLSLVVIARTIQVWRSDAPVAVRAAVLILASELVNPHVFVYDAVVLAPALVWLAASAYGESRSGRTQSIFTPIVYGLYLTLLVPTAALLPVQVSVLLLGGLFVIVSGDVLSSPRRHIEEPPVAVAPAS